MTERALKLVEQYLDGRLSLDEAAKLVFESLDADFNPSLAGLDPAQAARLRELMAAVAREASSQGDGAA